MVITAVITESQPRLVSPHPLNGSTSSYHSWWLLSKHIQHIWTHAHWTKSKHLQWTKGFVCTEDVTHVFMEHTAIYSVHLQHFIYLTNKANLESPVNLTAVCLDWGRKLEHLHTERSQLWIKLGIFLLWLVVLHHCATQKFRVYWLWATEASVYTHQHLSLADTDRLFLNW